MSPDVDAAAPSHPVDLAAPTDDRPFFGYPTPARLLSKAIREPRSLVPNSQGLLGVLMLGAAAIALLVVALLVPFVARPSLFLTAEGRLGRARALVFFMAVGFASIVFGAALVQSSASLIQHPTYGLAGALLAVLVIASLGALSTDSASAVTVARSAGRRAQILIVIAALYAAFGGAIFGLAAKLPLYGRVGSAVALTVPAAFFLGSLFPLGAKIVASRSPEILPWCVGVQRASSLVAVGVGVLLALHAGFSALFFAAGLVYLIAALTVPMAAPAHVISISAPVSVPVPAPVPAPLPVLAPASAPESESESAPVKFLDLPPGFGPPPVPTRAPTDLPPGFGPPPETAPPQDEPPPTVRRNSNEPASVLPTTRPSAGAEEPPSSGSST